MTSFIFVKSTNLINSDHDNVKIKLNVQIKAKETSSWYLIIGKRFFYKDKKETGIGKLELAFGS